MSSNARAAARREARAAARRLPDDVGLIIGWAPDEAALPEARQKTHDALIMAMGPLRLGGGGVSWRQVTGDSASEVLSSMTREEYEEHGGRAEYLDNFRRLRAHLREYGGWLVIATAPGRRP